MNNLAPVTREELFLAKLGGQDVNTPSPVTREELYLDILCGNSANVPAPFAREEIYLASLCGKNVQIPEPVTRKETFLAALCGEGILPPNPVTREEFFLEDWLDNNGEFLTVTGAIATFTTLRAAPLRSLAVTMGPVQDLNGYDSPWPAGGGKNLLNPDTVTKTSTIDYANGIWTMNPFNTSAQIITVPFASHIGDSVTVSFTAWASDTTTARFDGQPDSVCTSGTDFSDKTVNLTTNKNRFSYSGTILDGTTGFRIFRTSSIVGAQTVSIYIENIQIELGTTATDYAPYSNICPISGWTGANVYHSGADTSDATTYSITFPSEAGTVYSGTVDIVTGELTVTSAKITPVISDYQSINSYGIVNWRIRTPNCTNYDGKHGSNVLQQQTSTIASTKNEGFYISSSTYSYIRLLSSRATTSAEANQVIADNGVYIVYELAEPVTYQLTPQEVNSLLGENNVWSDADSVTVTYRSN